VILATKTQDTAGAVAALSDAAPATIGVVCAQNGVENERLVSEGFLNTIAMCVMCPATHLEPGVVQASSAPVSGILDVGCYPSGVDGTVNELAAALRGSTFASEARPDIMRWKYNKLLMNLQNAVEATCGFGAGTSEIVEMIRSEGVAALDAAGIDHASDEEDRERRGGLITLRPVGGERRGGGSSWQSLRRGTGSVEAEFLNGEIVRLGRIHGVVTPANEVVIGVAEELARTGGQPGSIDPASILELIGSA
jgi:2-dehydropantoate 2-reductase